MHWMRVKKTGDPGPVGKMPQLGRPRPKKLDFDHGTAQGYNYHKCRCDRCRTWAREYHVAHRLKQAEQLTANHGTSGYNYGCRCDVCKAAAKANAARMYVRHREALIANAMKQNAKRRARIRGGGAFVVSERDEARLLRRFDGLCAYCRENDACEIDHVVPISRGGRHSIGNLLPACFDCNRSKLDKFVVEWRAGRKRPRVASC
jgi:5-methylcytosine-specific restriction endonuclease McrA